MKLQLFVSPSLAWSWHFKLEVPESGASSLVTRTPAPDRYQTGRPHSPEEWTVQLSPHQMGYLRSLLCRIPLGGLQADGPVCDGTGYTLELSSGDQEARLSWRNEPPESWSELKKVVSRLNAWSGVDDRLSAY